MANFLQVDENNAINLDLCKRIIRSQEESHPILIYDQEGNSSVYRGEAAKLIWDAVSSPKLTLSQEQELERYREALLEIFHGPVGYWNFPEHQGEVVAKFMQIAKQALYPEQEHG